MIEDFSFESFYNKILEKYLNKGLHFDKVLFPKSYKNIMDYYNKGRVIPVMYSNDETLAFYITIPRKFPELAVQFKKEIKNSLALNVETPNIKVYYKEY